MPRTVKTQSATSRKRRMPRKLTTCVIARAARNFNWYFKLVRPRVASHRPVREKVQPPLGEPTRRLAWLIPNQDPNATDAHLDVFFKCSDHLLKAIWLGVSIIVKK